MPCRHERGAATLATVGLALMMLTTSAAMFMRGGRGAPAHRIERRVAVDPGAPSPTHASSEAQLDAQLREDCAMAVQRANADEGRGPLAERCGR